MVEEYEWCSFVPDEIMIRAANTVKNQLDQEQVRDDLKLTLGLIGS